MSTLISYEVDVSINLAHESQKMTNVMVEKGVNQLKALANVLSLGELGGAIDWKVTVERLVDVIARIDYSLKEMTDQHFREGKGWDQYLSDGEYQAAMLLILEAFDLDPEMVKEYAKL